MEFKQYVKRKLIPSYFVSVCCIALAMGVLGIIFEPDARFGYEVLFLPFIFGLVAALIQLVNYSKAELTTAQAAWREVIHVVLLEAGIMGILLRGGALKSAEVTVALALSILVIYLAVSLVIWLNDKRTTDEVNGALKTLQGRMAQQGE